MCLILDANQYGAFLQPNNEEMKPVKNWLGKGGKIIYSPTTRLKREIKRSPKMERLFLKYMQAGQLKRISKDDVEKEENTLTSLRSNLISNDKHIIALAIVSGSKLLISNDKDLQADFKNRVKGKIYQGKRHRHLLNKDTCP